MAEAKKMATDPEGNKLTATRLFADGECDKCGKDIRKGSRVWSCRKTNYDLCTSCCDQDVHAIDPEDEPIVNELKSLDDQYLALEREFEAAERALKQKFQERQAPLLKERLGLLANASEAKDDAAQSGTPALKGFWFKALGNHPSMKENSALQEWDEPVLDYLVDITSADIDDEHHLSFKLDFVFKENPFFEETLLSKTYTVKESSPWNGETEVKEIKSSPISWKAGQDITVAAVKKKVKGGGAKKKAKEKMGPRPSFFRNFLGVHLVEGGTVPEGLEELAKDVQEGMEDEDELEEEAIVCFMMERDLEMGMSIRDHVIPFAVRWYTGEAAPEADSDDSDAEDGDDDDDEDDDSSDEEPKAKSKAKQKAASKKDEDCKQQ